MMYAKYSVIGFFIITALAVIAGLVMCVRYVIKKPKEAGLVCIAIISGTAIGLPPFFFSTIGASIWWFGVIFVPSGIPCVVGYIMTRSKRLLHYLIISLLMSFLLSGIIYLGLTTGCFDTDGLGISTSVFDNTEKNTTLNEANHAA